MNLWLRLLWMLLTLPTRRRVGLAATTTLPMVVLPNDLDFNLHVNNGRYLTLADVARVDFILRNGSAGAAYRLRAKPVVGDAIAKFRRDLKPFQRFTIETRLLGWDERWTFIEHRFIRHKRVLGVVAIRGMFVGPGGPVSPAELLAAMAAGTTSPVVPSWISEWSQSCDALSTQLRSEEASIAICK